jgi:hypothetical protein
VLAKYNMDWILSTKENLNIRAFTGNSSLSTNKPLSKP